MKQMIFTFLLTLTFAVPFVNAQAPAPQAANVKISESDLKTFNKIQPKVMEMNQKMMEKAQAAAQKSPAEAQKVQQEQQQKIIEYVTKNGLSVEKFNAIVTRQQQ